MAVDYAHTSAAETRRRCKAKALAKFCYAHGILAGVPGQHPTLLRALARTAGVPHPTTPTAAAHLGDGGAAAHGTSSVGSAAWDRSAGRGRVHRMCRPRPTVPAARCHPRRRYVGAPV